MANLKSQRISEKRKPAYEVPADLVASDACHGKDDCRVKRPTKAIKTTVHARCLQLCAMSLFTQADLPERNVNGMSYSCFVRIRKDKAPKQNSPNSLVTKTI